MESLNNPILLEVKKITVVYHHVLTAIRGVSFKVTDDCIVAMIGVNGAGKTTTLRAVAGFLPFDFAEITDGTVEFCGEEINGKRPHYIASKGIVFVPERDKVFTTLTVEENFEVGFSKAVKGRNRKGYRETKEMILSYFTPLSGKLHLRSAYLSGGERQMLAIGMGLMGLTRLLMVDELSLGLSPIFVQHLLEVVKRIKTEMHISVLMVEQNAGAALQIADYAYVMENGRVVFEGTAEDLKGHEDVKEFYLGISGAAHKSYKDVKQYRRTRRWWN